MYKSQVAAEQVQAINPALKGRVLGVTHKLGAETENTFSAAFWQDTDLVVTALVNLFTTLLLPGLLCQYL